MTSAAKSPAATRPPTTRGKVTFAGPTDSPSDRSMITKRNSTMIAPA
jgi:hypothetical protein